MVGDDDQKGASFVFSDLIAVVPARSGSKSIKDKNLQKIEGHSLIAWAVHAAHQLQPAVVYLDTDSDVYADEGKRYGAEVPFLRKQAFAGDAVSDTQTFQEFLSRASIDPDVLIIHMRPTTPLRKPGVLKSALTQFVQTVGDATSLRSIHEMAETAYKSFELTENGLLRPLNGLVNSTETANLPRQTFPPTFVANGYIDIFPASNIERFQSLHGPSTMGFVTEATPEIDSSHELRLARLLARDSEFRAQAKSITKGLGNV